MSSSRADTPGRLRSGAFIPGRARSLALGLALGLALVPATAQDAPDPGELPDEARLYTIQDAAFTSGGAARLPVSIINGRLVVSCDVSTRARRLPANLFIDFESPSTLELHNQAAAGLRAESASGATIPITVHLPGLEFAIERRQIGDDQALDRFTRWYSIALGETAVIGTLGGEVWRNFNVTFDLPAGELIIEPLRSEGDVRDVRSLPPGTEVLEADLMGGLVWLRSEVRQGDDRRPGVFALGSGRYDTTLDWNLAAEFGAPAGNVDSAQLGGSSALDLTSRLALRPAEVPYAHPDGPLGVLGLDLLSDMRVEVDRVNRKVFVTPILPAELALADRAFHAATWDFWGPRDDPAALADWLATWCPSLPDEAEEGDPEPLPRLAEEAARALVELAIYDGAPLFELEPALAWLDRAVPADLRATSALEVMQLAASAAAPEAELAAGRLGVDGGRDDRYPTAVHEVHARMGRALLNLERWDEAWRSLLSAAFGDPANGPVNLGLGEYYEHQARELLAEGREDQAAGRFRRSFSRFLQAAIQPDSGPSGVEGMARVQADLTELDPEGGRFGAALVERLIAGKVRNFGAPGTFERGPEHDPDKVVLVEYFTNPYIGDETNGGAIAGGMAQEGLQQHFASGAVAFLTHHLPDPRLGPLTTDFALTRANSLAIDQPVYQVVDGAGRIRSLGKWRDAETLYTNTKRAIEGALAEAPTASIELDAELVETPNGPVVRGELRVTNKRLIAGPAQGIAKLPRVHLVLAEERVIFPGQSGVVIHRMVARGELLAADLKGASGSWPFEVALDDLERANESALERLVDEGAGAVRKLSLDIDPAEVKLVAWVEVPGGPVGQAHVMRPRAEEQP